MGYELHVRRRAPEALLPEQPRMEAALRELGATGADGAFTVMAGGARVPARLARSEGALSGVDLDVPYGAPDDDFRAALLLGAQLAAKLDLTLLDPQLAIEITPASADRSYEGWRTANGYAVNTAGVVEDVRNAVPVQPPPPFLTLRTKVILAGLGVLLLAYALMNWALDFLIHPALKPID